MGKVSTFFDGLLCIALLGGIGYGGYYLYSNLEPIPTSQVDFNNNSTQNNTQVTDNIETTLNGDTQSTESIANEQTTEPPTTHESGVMFRNVQVSNDTDLHSGNLVNITIDNYMNYNIDSLELCNIYGNKVQSYSVSNSSSEICTHVITEINTMLTEFSQATGNTDAMIKTAFMELSELTDYPQCDHISGLSFNLSSYDGNTITDFDGTGDFSWIAERADKYGFIQRFPSDKKNYTGVDEPSHFRYVGLPHSAYMKENNLCLEEYIATVKFFTYSSPLEYTTFNGRTYNIYYVPMEEDNSTTNIPVLMDKEYSISGDNVSGFIVTVKISG